MKTVLNLSFLISSVLLLYACNTSRMLVDDDVYVVKSTALPIGESLTDETSYSTFKHRKKNNSTSEKYYNGDRNYLYDRNCNYYAYDLDGCGCSFYAWNLYSNYYTPYGFYGNRSLYYGHGFYNAFGPYVYDPFLGVYIYSPYYYNPYGYYSGVFYGSPYYPYDYGYVNYVAGNYSFVTPEIHTNQHSGPRGSISGYGDPSRRNTNPNTNILKNASTTPEVQKPHTISTLRDQPLGRMPAKNKVEYERQDLRPSNVRPVRNEQKNYRPAGEIAPRQNPSQNRPVYNRPVNIQQRPTQQRDINHPNRNRQTQPSRNRGIEPTRNRGIEPSRNREAQPKGSGSGSGRGGTSNSPGNRRN